MVRWSATCVPTTSTSSAIATAAPTEDSSRVQRVVFLNIPSAGKALFYRQLETGIAAAYEDASRTMACNMMEEAALEGVQIGRGLPVDFDDAPAGIQPVMRCRRPVEEK